jgi:hypothetical protein
VTLCVYISVCIPARHFDRTQGAAPRGIWVRQGPVATAPNVETVSERPSKSHRFSTFCCQDIPLFRLFLILSQSFIFYDGTLAVTIYSNQHNRVTCNYCHLSWQSDG